MVYQLAEKFKSVQGEGVYAGTGMAFIRFVGCSVGKTICNFCDTDFEKPVPWRGGGEFTLDQLAEWWYPYTHICLTGGEPLDQDLMEFHKALGRHTRQLTIHVETSGTKSLPMFMQDSLGHPDRGYWVCVSPKPGFREDVVMAASEVKVIMPGLGRLAYGIPASSWPTLQDALRWADAGKIVFVQPKNDRNDIDMGNLRLCQDIVAEYPQLRLSVQLHKVLKVQ